MRHGRKPHNAMVSAAAGEQRQCREDGGEDGALEFLLRLPHPKRIKQNPGKAFFSVPRKEFCPENARIEIFFLTSAANNLIYESHAVICNKIAANLR